jgi:hypothetical protein
MYCKYCGKKINKGSKFCKYCGKVQKEAEKPEDTGKKKLSPNKKLAIILATVIPVVLIGIIFGIWGGINLFRRHTSGYTYETEAGEDGVAMKEVAADLEADPDLEIVIPECLDCEEQTGTESLSEQDAISKFDELSNTNLSQENTISEPDYDFSTKYPDGWTVEKVENESGLYINYTSPEAKSLGVEICSAVFKSEPLKSCPPENLACFFAINNADYENWTYLRSEEHSSDFKVYEFYYADESGTEYLLSFIFADKCEDKVMYTISTKADYAYVAYPIVEMMLDSMTCEELFEQVVKCPEITDISFADSEREEVTALETNGECYAQVTVQGADSGDLYYDWTMPAGCYIEDDYGSYIRFYAPGYPGYCDITVCIYGPDDCMDCYTETIQVTEPEQVVKCPEITDISFADSERKEVTALETNGECYAQVTVQGADSSDLYYDWTEVPGDYIEDDYGSYIRFYAPGYPGYYDITVCIYGPDDCTDCYTETVEVVESWPLENSCPIITEITYEDQGSYEYIIEANVTDPDGDSLYYNWSVSGGWILWEDGDTIRWEAETSYIWYITVEVSDGECVVSETIEIDN